MKKILFVMLVAVLIITGCEEKQKDYSEYGFTDTRWVRDGKHDVETIRFNSDGSFTYSCACGNAVDDYDLCDSYNYNDKTKEITLKCFEVTEEMITEIKIVGFDEETLELDFNGETRLFNKEK